MGYFSIILFLLGVVFLFLGWRCQSPPSEEAMTALKGLGYLKREILRVQDQVNLLEDRILIAQQIELKESAIREVERKEVERKESERKELERKEIGRKEIGRREIEVKEKNKLYHLKTKGQRERTSGDGGEPKRTIPPKYQEVLELSDKGNSIPQIAQNLLLSQDAVMMVLQMHSKGATR